MARGNKRYRSSIAALSMGLMALGGALGDAQGATFTVTNTDDSGAGSLRQALLDADAAGGSDRIEFDIPGAGPHVIENDTSYPAVAGGVEVDGLSQPGASCDVWPPTLLIELTGGSTTDSNKNGLVLEGDSTVRGLAVNGYVRGSGILLVPPGNSRVECSYVGTDVTGTTAIPNSRGILVGGFGDENTGNVIGGTTPTTRNLISGNRVGVAMQSGAAGTLVQGNYVGTDPSGTSSVPNSEDGILTNASDDNVIGGTAPGAGNLVSGNSIDGISITSGSERNRVEGNLVGVDVTGVVALPNQTGIAIEADDNVIGGLAPGAGNVVAGNRLRGISLFNFPAGTRIQGNFIGTDASATLELGNGGDGILVSSAFETEIGGLADGAGNVIAHNGESGVSVSASFSPTVGVRVSGNDIYSNVELAIDLTGPSGSGSGVNFNDPGDADTGANGFQNYPRLIGVPVQTGASSVAVSGSLDSTPDQTFRVEFFASEQCDESRFGEAQRYLSSIDVMTDAQGNASFSTSLSTGDVPQGWFVTSTATTSDGNTSEVSQCDAVPGTAVVTTTEDSGEGSLREAINFTNADPDSDLVSFAIDAATDLGCDSDTGACTIRPNQSLPALKGATSIDGLTQAGADCSVWPPQLKIVIEGDAAGRTSGIRLLDIGSRVTGLVVNGFESSGIFLGDQGNHVAECNFVGTDVTGMQSAPNDFAGVSLGGANNRVGGSGVQSRNLISGNDRYGVYTRSASSAEISGNYIGTDVTGMSALGNVSDGIHLELNFNSNEDGGHRVGGLAPNVVAFNGRNGIDIRQDGSTSTSTTSNRVTRNSTFENVGLGLVVCDERENPGCENPATNDPGDADEGANNGQNFPDITSIVGDGEQSISATFVVDSAPASSAYPLTVEFFIADADDEEGQTYLGFIIYSSDVAQQSVTTAFTTAATLSNGDQIIATATDAEGNTSEFSETVTASGSANPPPDVIFADGFE